MSRVLLSVDMEGIAGITGWNQCTPNARDWWDYGRPCMEIETLAAVRGLKTGFEYVTVVDAHAMSNNLDREAIEYDPTVDLVQGDLYSMGMVPQVGNYQSLVMIGCHGMTGAPGNMSHNIIGGARLYLNDKQIGEVTLNAMAAADMGVPTLLVAGDECACEEAMDNLPGVRVVVTKFGQRNGTYTLRPHRECIQELQDFIGAAIRRPAPVPKLDDGMRSLRLEYRRLPGGYIEVGSNNVASAYAELLVQLSESRNPTPKPRRKKSEESQMKLFPGA
jgi:D-amino peptidase